ncbi:MAG TPA: hypothetical protein VJ461_06175 [Candidatus Nanoarchaeia archaeon]|nr:hypothetical protein [Candidatus Nanoarchaeia archaeon]
MGSTIIRVTPDRKKAESILGMVEQTLAMLRTIDETRFPSQVAKELYDVIRELISIIMLLDGYKTFGEGAHKVAIDYLKSYYTCFSASEISLIDRLRIIRNRITYDGFFVQSDFVARRKVRLRAIIDKLKKIISKKMSNHPPKSM